MTDRHDNTDSAAPVGDGSDSVSETGRSVSPLDLGPPAVPAVPVEAGHLGARFESASELEMSFLHWFPLHNRVLDEINAFHHCQRLVGLVAVDTQLRAKVRAVTSMAHLTVRWSSRHCLSPDEEATILSQFLEEEDDIVRISTHLRALVREMELSGDWPYFPTHYYHLRRSMRRLNELCQSLPLVPPEEFLSRMERSQANC